MSKVIEESKESTIEDSPKEESIANIHVYLRQKMHGMEIVFSFDEKPELKSMGSFSSGGITKNQWIELSTVFQSNDLPSHISVHIKINDNLVISNIISDKRQNIPFTPNKEYIVFDSNNLLTLI